MSVMDLDDQPSSPPVSFRSFTDYPAQRQAVYERAKRAFSRRKPLENATYRLEVTDVDYEGPYNPTKREEKEALLHGKSLQRPLRGTVRLISQADGSVVDEQRATVARIPHLSSRGMYVRKGIPWVLRNQTRLRPGVYTRTRNDGGVEAHFNIKPGSGRGFRLHLDPKSGMFKFEVGQSTTKLYPLMRALGVSDEELKKAWGEELFNTNFRPQSQNDIKDAVKVVEKLSNKKLTDVDRDLAPQLLRELIQKAEIDPDTAELTLGRRLSHLSPANLLSVTQRVLRVARQEEKPDNRDSQSVQSIHAPESLIEERLIRDQSGALRKLLWKATRENKLPKIQAGLMDKDIGALFDGTGLAMSVEDINPFEIYDMQQGITRLGEGGISSETAVSRSARGVQASYLGVIDSGRGPECYDSATEVMTRKGWVPWPEVAQDTEFACMVDGKVFFAKADNLYRAHYEGIMYGVESRHLSYLVTPDHRMWTQCPGRKRDGSLCQFNIQTAEQVHEHHRRVLSSGFASAEIPDEISPFVLPLVEASGTERQVHGNPPIGARLKNHCEPIDIVDWCAFLGWYISEGNIHVRRGGMRPEYRATITQSGEANPKNCEEIEALLDRLPFSWCRVKDKSFVIGVKQLAVYLEQFGKSQDKFLPEYVFSAPVKARQALFDALLKGDGKGWHGNADDRRTYFTASPRLARDIERLAFSLGKSTKLSCIKDTREERYLDVFGVYMHTSQHRELCPARTRKRTGQSDFYTTQYCGEVHCATVPGGLLYVRRNGKCGFWCGNSSKLGLDLRVTDGAMLGSDGQLYARVRNARTGEQEIVPSRELSAKVVTFPGELAKEGKRVPAVVDDHIQYVDRDQVDYEIPSANHMMSRASAMIPFPESVKGQRLLMGSRMVQQAVPLVEAEAPLVQTADEDRESLYAKMGEAMGAVRSPVSGTVLRVKPDSITVRTDDGQVEEVSLFNHYPSARKTYVHNTPVVQAGDRVDSQQLLARSNFTDDTGRMAIGRNARVAFMAAEGDTLEDAFVISESMAKKLRSQAMYQPDLDLTDVHSTKKSDYRALYADKYTQEQYDRLDDDGAAQVGQIIQPGDPVILAIGNKPKRGVGAIMNTPRSAFSDKTVTWDHHAPGVVTDVSKTRRGIKVLISSEQDVQPGDKISGRYGNKGVISTIRPDDQMPVDESGQPIEVLFSSLGIVSRVNPGALAESMLGKVAAKVGEDYVVPSFSGENVALTALHEALKHGVIKEDENGNLVDTETLTDPRTGRSIPGVFTGVSYVMKPHHMAESKLSARSQASYTLDGLPAKGGKEGSKRVALLDTFSLLSAGATEFLKDAKLVRGQRNDEYWRAVRAGETPPKPSVSFANEKFKDLLTAAGVNLRDKGSTTQLSPLIDEDVERLARHEVQNSKTFDFESMHPVPGGLFDTRITGGADGTLWSRISLPEKVPHPLFVDPIQRLLGLTGKQMQAVLSGQEKLGSQTGPKAIESALKDMNVGREINKAKNEIQNTRGTKRDQAVRRLNYLTGLQNMEVNPESLMVSMVPVIPPKHRPIVSGSKKDMINDLNYLYHDLMEARDNYQQAMETFGEAGDEYLTMMHAHQAVVGKRAPVSQQSVEQGLKGILQTAIGVGDTPKRAHFLRKVVGSTVDTVGRSVITSDPNLDMDQISLPENMAWEIYRPYVVRRLVRLGSPASEALRRVDEKDPAAKRLLEEEMQARPVVYNRAPSLHQYSYVAAYPKLRDDDAIGLPYYTLGGLGADFDGDNVNIHVPSSDEAVTDAKEKLLPSRNLIASGNFQARMTPIQDYLAGLYLATQPKSDEDVHVFKDAESARRAYHRGEISLRTPIRIREPV